MNVSHDKWMDDALALAERGRGAVSPDPLVGAVIVRDDCVVGRGWHQQYGGPHAEIFALREAGEAARGATLYCTLEPCNHTGKTPPCTRAVIEAGISRVVLGASDPNPLATGGIDALRAAGIEIVEGIHERQCRHINAPFFKFVSTGLPFVTLKWAMTLDGRVATASGDSKWISGEASRALVHEMRASHDAVLAGIGTVLADNPSLNARNQPAENGQPRRVILDDRASTPLEGNLWTAQPAEQIVIVTASSQETDRRARIDALQNKGAEVVQLPPDSNGRIDITQALRALASRGILSVFVEGGPKTHGRILDARLADQAFVFIAPKIVGGAVSRATVEGAGIGLMQNVLKSVSPTSIKKIGDDLLVEAALSDWGAL